MIEAVPGEHGLLGCVCIWDKKNKVLKIFRFADRQIVYTNWAVATGTDLRAFLVLETLMISTTIWEGMMYKILGDYNKAK